MKEKDLTIEEFKTLLLEERLDEDTIEDCLIMRTLDILNGKWKSYVIYELSKKKSCRFSELKKAIPKITNTMLTSSLRELESIGVVYREQFNEIPPHVEYSLTQKGEALLPIFYEIYKW